MGIEWHSIEKEGFPKEEGEYLVTVKSSSKSFISVCRFSLNLNKVYEDDFPITEYKNKKGFYKYYSGGYYEYPDVIAWEKVEPYKKINNKQRDIF